MNHRFQCFLIETWHESSDYYTALPPPAAGNSSPACSTLTTIASFFLFSLIKAHVAAIIILFRLVDHLSFTPVESIFRPSRARVIKNY
jgi:hypothetical protein